MLDQLRGRNRQGVSSKLRNPFTMWAEIHRGEETRGSIAKYCRFMDAFVAPATIRLNQGTGTGSIRGGKILTHPQGLGLGRNFEMRKFAPWVEGSLEKRRQAKKGEVGMLTTGLSHQIGSGASGRKSTKGRSADVKKSKICNHTRVG